MVVIIAEDGPGTSLWSLFKEYLLQLIPNNITKYPSSEEKPELPVYQHTWESNP